MAYNITLTNGTPLLTLQDSTEDSTTTSLNLIGRNYTGFGLFFNENFVHLLEHFSSATAPINPLVGQLWWDSTNKHLSVWQGTNWKVISSSQTGATSPPNPIVGDFWWNPSQTQFYVYSGTSWIPIGPYTANVAPATSSLAQFNVVDNTSTTHYVGNVTVNNKFTGVFSSDSVAFTPASPALVGGLATIYPGLNLPGAVAAANVTANLTTTSNLAVTNSANIANNLAVGGNLTVGSNLTVGGQMTVSGNVTFTGNLSVSGTTTFNGTTTATTQSPGDSSTKVATTAFVSAATSGLGTMSTQNANSVTITGGSINGVSGTNSSMTVGNATNATNATNVTGTIASGVTATTQTNGDNSTKVATTAYAQSMDIGWSQTWQNVAGSRSTGTTYTNSTGKPIMVSVTTYSTYNPSTSITVGGVLVSFSEPNTNGGNNAYASAQAIVPNGATYVVNGSTVYLWAELR